MIRQAERWQAEPSCQGQWQVSTAATEQGYITASPTSQIFRLELLAASQYPDEDDRAARREEAEQ